MRYRIYYGILFLEAQAPTCFQTDYEMESRRRTMQNLRWFARLSGNSLDICPHASVHVPEIHRKPKRSGVHRLTDIEEDDDARQSNTFGRRDSDVHHKPNY
ncbi:hypothetical protein L210DRAFT_943509, partial [Boletus edulis BED1]